MKKEAFRALPFGRKVQYLICKYLPQAVLGAMLLLVVSTWIYEDYIKDPVYMNVEMINACTESPDGESFDPFLRQAGYPCEKQKVEIRKVLQLGDGENQISCDPSKLLMCSVAQGKTDLFFWDAYDLEMEMGKVALMDLRDVLPRETLLRYQDRLVYTAPVLDGGYPCGIILRNNPWVQQNNYYEECIVGVSRSARDFDMIRAFFEYILSTNQQPSGWVEGNGSLERTCA